MTTEPSGINANAERAEERLDRIGEQLSHFFNSGAKPFVLKTVGRAREEAEDIWAEAQAASRQERSVMRRGVTYSLAGAMRAAERLGAAARGAAEGARNTTHSGEEGEPAPTGPAAAEPAATAPAATKRRATRRASDAG